MGVPRNISIIGVYTGHIFLLIAILTLWKKMYIMSGLSTLIYITTVFHWRDLHKHSIIKYLDICIALVSILYVTFIASHHFKQNHRDLWILLLCIGVGIYALNCLFYYYQTERSQHKMRHFPNIQENYDYFSLNYIPITNFSAREKCYFTTTLVHTCTWHLMIGAAMIYFISHATV